MSKSLDSKTGRLLALALRHKPEVLGLTLDDRGYADVWEILKGFRHPVTFEDLKRIVETNDKQRFAFNSDCTKIRASQGHSIYVDLGYKPVVPPPVLYHGTAVRVLSLIKDKGLIKGTRQHVHLSADYETAENVGRRHGYPVVLDVYSAKMAEDGYEFYLSANGVWLTDHVPAKYLGENNG